MFCPKCGGQNPETGKFCRGCGTDLGNVSSALAAPPPQKLVNRQGKPMDWEGAITKMFMGLAFLVVSIILGFTNMGRGWWFWMLIPAFGCIGSGVAQYVQLRKAEKEKLAFAGADQQKVGSATPNNALPAPQTEWVAPESRYKTGDLVPPSVTDGTTRHLEINSEGDTMTLPKR